GLGGGGAGEVVVGRFAAPGLGPLPAGPLVDRASQVEDAVASVHQHDGAGAAVGQLAGDRLADAAGRPGHHGHLVEDEHGTITSLVGEPGRPWPGPRGCPLLGTWPGGPQEGGRGMVISSNNFSMATVKSRTWPSEAWRTDSKHFCHSSMVLARSSSGVLASPIWKAFSMLAWPALNCASTVSRCRRSISPTAS